MNRSTQLIARPKRTLGALALGLCAIGVAVGSGADFSAQTANPGNTFSAGSLSMDNSKDGRAIFSPSDLIPGRAMPKGVVDIENTGTILGHFKLTRDALESHDNGSDNPAPFASKVNLSIVDCGKFESGVAPTCGDRDDMLVYEGTLQGENSDHALGMYLPGERHRYEFGGGLDSSAGDQFQGDSSTAGYVFSATQTH